MWRAAGKNSGSARGQEIIRRFKHAELFVQRLKAVGKGELYTLTQVSRSTRQHWIRLPGALGMPRRLEALA